MLCWVCLFIFNRKQDTNKYTSFCLKMSQITLNPEEVLAHLKNILGSDLDMTIEQFQTFLHDLRKLIRKDQKKLQENSTISDKLESCSCQCHFDVSSSRNIVEGVEYESMITDYTEETTNLKNDLKLQVLKPASSFIRPWRTRPDIKVRKDVGPCDPVQLYQQYKTQWQQHHIPGEQNHSSIRWNIREKMLGQEPQPRPKPLLSARSRSSATPFVLI